MTSDGNKSAPNEQSAISFSNDVRTAIELRTEFYRTAMDQEFKASGGRIVYAVDSNVLNRHFSVNPEEHTNYGAISRAFSGPPDSPVSPYEQKLDEILTSYITRSLGLESANPTVNQPTPLVLLPGHSLEASKPYTRLIEKLSQHDDRSRVVKRTLDDLLTSMEKIEVPAGRVEFMQTHADEFHKAIYGLDEPHEKFREFNRLLTRPPRLLSMRRAARHSTFKDLTHPTTGVSIFADLALAKKRKIPAGSTKWWERCLKGRWGKSGKQYIEADAIALSALDRLNRNLWDQDTRVILITTSRHIIDLGETYRPMKHSDKELGRYSFTDLYLRHPRGFLSTLDLSASSSDSTSNNNLTRTLDILLGRIAKSDHWSLLNFRKKIQSVVNDSDRLLELTGRALSQKPDAHADFFERWLDYIKNVTEAHSGAVGTEATRQFVQSLNSKDPSRLDILKDYQILIQKLTEDSWNEFYLAAAQSGYHLVGVENDGGRKLYSRVPILYMRGIREFSQIRRMLASKSKVVKHESEIRAVLDNLEQQNGGDSSYVSSLCYALLFAHAEQWSVAKLLAQRAVRYAEKSRQDKEARSKESYKLGGISGREAYYLGCVATRRTARSASDLNGCYEMIEIATSLASKESSPTSLLKGDNIHSDAHVLTGIRFKAEKIAIRIAKLLFEAHESDWLYPDVNSTTQTIDEIISDIFIYLDESTVCEDADIHYASRISLRSYLFASARLLEHIGRSVDFHINDIACFAAQQVSEIGAYSAETMADSGEICASAGDIFLTLYAVSFQPFDHVIVDKMRRSYRNLHSQVIAHKRFMLTPYDARWFRLIAESIEQKNASEQ